jgi:carbon monoxide dehydrogenase subunit G
MKIEQSFVVDAPADRVWSLIRDPEIMVGCVPGCDAIEQVDDTTYTADVTVSVGPIKATFSLVIEVVEEVPPILVKTLSRGEEGSRASMVKSVNEMRLTRLAGGETEIAYSADVEISGRLGRYGAGMMKKIATKLAGKFEESFRQLAEASETVTG